MLARDIPFTQIFSSVIKPVVSEEKDRLLALASMQELSTFVPNIDTARNIDLLPIAFDACVINRGNKNGDLIDTDTALATYKTFIHKFIDTEHNRQRVIGVILTASLTEFATGRILREEDVRGKDVPFNITLGGVLWKAVNQDLCDLVEESNDPTSEHYMKISASWELGFSGYKVIELAQGEKNLALGNVIQDPEFISGVKKYLKCFGGSGVMNGKSYYRMPNQDVIAMGVGLTEKPAADVQGIAIKLEETEQPSAQLVAATKEFDSKNITSIEENISQNEKINVKQEREHNMKITSISDITDENSKQCSASAVTEFIASEIKKASDVYSAEKLELASANQTLKAATEDLSKTVLEMKASLETLQKEKSNREQVDLFNGRMSEVCASYVLPDEISKIVADDLKACASEEAYASWKVKATALLKPYSLEAIAAAKKEKDEAEAKFKAFEKKGDKKDDKEADKDGDDKKEDKKDDKKDAKASEAVASVVEAALDNADKKDAGLPNSSSAAAPGFKERFATAFASDNFVIKI